MKLCCAWYELLTSSNLFNMKIVPEYTQLQKTTIACDGRCVLQVGYFWVTLVVMCVLYTGIYRVALDLQRKSEAKHRQTTNAVSLGQQQQQQQQLLLLLLLILLLLPLLLLLLLLPEYRYNKPQLKISSSVFLTLSLHQSSALTLRPMLLVLRLHVTLGQRQQQQQQRQQASSTTQHTEKTRLSTAVAGNSTQHLACADSTSPLKPTSPLRDGRLSWP